MMRLKFAATINDEALPENVDPDFEIAYVDIGNVDSSGTIHEIVDYRFEAAPSRARRIVQDGDVIISTVRTYLQAIAPIISPPENLIVSTGFAVVRPRSSLLDPGFCRYAVREPRFLAEVEMRSTGISYPAINASEIGDIVIALPELPVQRRTSAFLDAELAQIDALIEAKQKLLDLLAEKRRTLVAEAIMRGLDRSAPLRPCGIEWLGDIPAHWKIERSRWLFSERDERSDTGEEEMLTVSHITGVTPRSEKDVNMFEAETTAGYKLCFTGDLVINTLWAWMGAMGTAPIDGIVSPAYNVYSPGPCLLPAYVDALVRIPVFAQEVTRYSKGVWSSRLRLYPEGFFETFWPVPPLNEQEQIVAHIAEERTKIDKLASATERSITLLKERRSALIAAAVTGQIDIPEAA
ncbi:type I restriction enzyme S subunit [Neorhizobium galegae]|uniref:restriction endonuclease subunit S n=1 Tax=Neorhizobium galegae TaxID=399 RepID=UPI001AE40978|nr:restriction endonuclease subunit S [Neorhizobium galegae]MBP2549689.1 type I restriction enzyme S subunit [Neorhizobium galegae]